MGYHIRESMGAANGEKQDDGYGQFGHGILLGWGGISKGSLTISKKKKKKRGSKVSNTTIV